MFRPLGGVRWGGCKFVSFFVFNTYRENIPSHNVLFSVYLLVTYSIDAVKHASVGFSLSSRYPPNPNHSGNHIRLIFTTWEQRRHCKLLLNSPACEGFTFSQLYSGFRYCLSCYATIFFINNSRIRIRIRIRVTGIKLDLDG